MAGEVQVILIGPDTWIKLGDSRMWTHATTEKLAGTSMGIADPENPGGIMTMINTVNGVEHDVAGGFKGTLDLTKSPTATADTIAEHGEKMRKMPFAATVHPDGSLHTFVVDMSPLAAGYRMTATYTDYGKPFEVTAPPQAETIEMGA